MNPTARQYLDGYCHVMALAWQKLLPGSKLMMWTQFLEDVDWDDLPEWKQHLDDPYDVIHVWCEDASGHAYDALGKHANTQALIQAWESQGGTHYVDEDLDQIDQVHLKMIRDLVNLGELKSYNAAQVKAAVDFIQEYLL